MLLKIFKKKNKTIAAEKTGDGINYNYVCLTSDPVNTINDLRAGNWNMEKVRHSLAMGILRYAKQSEVDMAKANGRIKE